MELGCNFILIIYSTAKISSVQIIIALKMQTYDFDFYYHFNPLQKLFNVVLPSWKNPTTWYLLKLICNQKNLTWKDNFLKSVFEPWLTTFLKPLPPDWNTLQSMQIPLPLLQHIPGPPPRSNHSAQSVLEESIKKTNKWTQPTNKN